MYEELVAPKRLLIVARHIANTFAGVSEFAEAAAVGPAVRGLMLNTYFLLVSIESSLFHLEQILSRVEAKR